MTPTATRSQHSNACHSAVPCSKCWRRVQVNVDAPDVFARSAACAIRIRGKCLHATIGGHHTQVVPALCDDELVSPVATLWQEWEPATRLLASPPSLEAGVPHHHTLLAARIEMQHDVAPVAHEVGGKGSASSKHLNTVALAQTTTWHSDHGTHTLDKHFVTAAVFFGLSAVHTAACCRAQHRSSAKTCQLWRTTHDVPARRAGECTG